MGLRFSESFEDRKVQERTHRSTPSILFQQWFGPPTVVYLWLVCSLQTRYHARHKKHVGDQTLPL